MIPDISIPLYRFAFNYFDSQSIYQDILPVKYFDNQNINLFREPYRNYNPPGLLFSQSLLPFPYHLL